MQGYISTLVKWIVAFLIIFLLLMLLLFSVFKKKETPRLAGHAVYAYH
ncbi:MAG: hypothetical protein ACXVP5_07275 [Tumebacillaceae bacterium]